MSITVNVVVEFVSLKEHVIKYEFLSLKNRYASIKLAHAQACIKEKKEKEKTWIRFASDTEFVFW